jgi:hypothetical protein
LPPTDVDRPDRDTVNGSGPDRNVLKALIVIVAPFRSD